MFIVSLIVSQQQIYDIYDIQNENHSNPIVLLFVRFTNNNIFTISLLIDRIEYSNLVQLKTKVLSQNAKKTKIGKN